MIFVTKPFLPPREEYKYYLDGIWKRQWLTNMGPLANELELRLKDYLDLKHLLFVTSGTIALQMAIKALELTGEIITTPFSFVATTSSIVWEGCVPVFVEINPETLNIDASKIEAAITSKTSAILATHVYGNPCDIDAIEVIAKKHKLNVIYDGAHAFGVKYRETSIFERGDISICSLHATKLYHSIEGGLLVTKNSNLLKKLAYIRNFGFDGPEAFAELGINGKNSEFHAAMGLTNLKYVDDIIEKRKQLSKYYIKKLYSIKGRFPEWNKAATKNYAYFPVIFDSEELLLRVRNILNLHEISTRRYFFPSLARSLPYLSPVELPITEGLSKTVLCLPLFHDLSFEEIELITRLILRVQNN